MAEETKLRKRARIILANTVKATNVQKVCCAVVQAQVLLYNMKLPSIPLIFSIE